MCCGLSAWAGCRPQSHIAPSSAVETTTETTAYQPPHDEGFVGSAACGECHQQIAAAYRAHPMARSIAPVDAAATAALLARGTHVVGQQRVYDVELRDGELLHHERMYDADGEQIYDQAVRMDYVVGSGQRARAYLHQRGSLLFMSPLNWYAQSQAWDLAPGYTGDDPRRFDRRITDECLGCHAGRVATAGRGTNTYHSPPVVEFAIGCERCHGPGARHVALHQAQGKPSADQQAIVNPARLDPDRRESVCNQCHLQATRIPRPGRTDLDFRPGMGLEDVWGVLDAGSDVTADGRTRSVNHVQQMRDSRCFSGSQGRFGCVSCHDPHRLPAPAERDAFYRERCHRCHSESACAETRERRAERGDSCIACHMPRRASSNMAHVSQTDHRVLRRESAEDQPAPDRAPEQLVLFDAAQRRLPEWEQQRCLALGARQYLSKKGERAPRELAPLLARSLEHAPEDGPVLIALGALAAEHGLTARAREHFEAAGKLASAEESALSGLLDLHYLAGDRQSALACAERLLDIDPGDARVRAIRADLLAQSGDSAGAIAEGRRALELNPTLLPVREWLVRTLRQAGHADEAAEQERILRRLRTARPPTRAP